MVKKAEEPTLELSVLLQIFDILALLRKVVLRKSMIDLNLIIIDNFVFSRN